MPKSDVFCQWTGVQFSHGAGPTVVSIGQVESMEFDTEGAPLYWSGDAAQGPTHLKIVGKKREVTLVGADAAKLMAVPVGVTGTLTGVLNDIENGTGSGALTLTLANCKAYGAKSGGQHNQVAKTSLKFGAVWLNGTTDPLTVTQAP